MHRLKCSTLRSTAPTTKFRETRLYRLISQLSLKLPTPTPFIALLTMVPSSAVTSPDPDGSFTNIKTVADRDQDNGNATHKVRTSPWAENLALLGNIAQVIILSSIVLYLYGQLFLFSDSYTKVSVTIGFWYGVPAVKPKGASVGHSEMVRPTFFFFFCFIPVAVSILLVEFLRHFNVRRITSRHVLNFTRFLRLKPRVLGRVIPISIGEFFFLAFLVGGNIYVFQYYYRARVARMKLKTPVLDFVAYLEIVALTFGFVCIYNMAFLFLPATRNCVWMEFLNISYANGIKYHRWLGVITVLAALLHCTGFYWAWIKEGTWVEEALPCFRDCAVGDDGKDRWMNTFGTIALLCFLTITATSLPWVRRTMYNTFYSVHHLFILATVFVVLHWNNTLAWLFPSVMLYTFCRALSSSNGCTPVVVREFTTLSHDVVKIVVARSTTMPGGYKVGQFVYLNVPAISKLQWHAFTISSSPRTSPDTMTILLKALGDWTAELASYSDDCKAKGVLPIVYVDGFYGASLELYDEYPTVCLIGGGIGVTPLIAILEDIVFKVRQGMPLRQKIFFIFTFREISLLEEIHPLLMQIRELDPQEKHFNLHFSLTRLPNSDQLALPIDHNRLKGAPHASTTQDDTTMTGKNPQPFAQPLARYCTSKAAVYTLSFFLTLVIWIAVQYGTKVQVHDKNLWPLQNFVEIVLVILVVTLIVYACAFAEAKMSKGTNDAFGQGVTPGGIQPYASDVHTFRDLISEYQVNIGNRPSMDDIMRKVHDTHKELLADDSEATYGGNSTVGVFVSGPAALKRSTENAISTIGIREFDVHEEEFDL
ncbi:unnamed protein product [Phytophthora fragariaefolia]|uniref:Unnamed protein product n=1 Tax=Phytophthora fragariaefolia TaxID=1490495 RepID=A0A9W7CQH5_9STRA|nr:unnamed protein product [Phytophthora fragariaefolia]